MKLLPLSDLRDCLAPGHPLPWGVRDAAGRLLLGRGHLLESEDMLAALLARGVFVDAEEARMSLAPKVVDPAPDAPAPETPFERWDRLCANLGPLLLNPSERFFLKRLNEASAHVHALSESNSDLLLFLILRQDHGRFEAYGVTHALHVACVCSLLAQRLGWDRADRERLIGAALTMNIAMLQLQGTLARQAGPPTKRQRELIHEHPLQAARLLRTAGLDDEAWLTAVEDHHERSGGGGYPRNRAEPGMMSQLLRLTDQFTAKHSARATRPALPAQVAARQFFTENPGDSLAALVIKEFGIYPPGCLVRLVSGELAIVVRRGRSANAPVVATLTNGQGRALVAPELRDTSRSAFAIASSVPEPAARVRLSAKTFFPDAATTY